MAKHKLGIIGLGKIADYHIRGIKNNSNLDLVGGYDLVGDPNNKLQDAKLYSSVEEMLQDPNIDTVLLLVPVSKKFELSLQILNAGKNLVTEKPATETISELEELDNISRRMGVKLYGAFHSRYSPTAREIVNLLNNGPYMKGEITEVEIWADSPHIVNGEILGKSSERTSLLAEGPNILAELALYVDGISILSSKHINYSDTLPEVETVIEGTFSGGNFRGITSWIRGKKEKGVRIKFKDGRELIAIHTEQKLHNEKGELIFDGQSIDPDTPRMQKEYNGIYMELDDFLTGEEHSNFELLKIVAEVIERASKISVKVDYGVLPKVK